jgi:D-alanyl-lipoteichoic acid acyltransferase DltB (MBOAT superfamily)
MLFNSTIFAVFFAVFFPVYLLVRHNVMQRNLLLIVGSYVFYGLWDPRFLILVAISTSVDYMAALGAAGKPCTLIDRIKSGVFLLLVTAGSLIFASKSDLWLAPLVCAGVAVVGGITFLIDRAPAKRRRIYWLSLSMITNLGILAFFKYFNFFVGSLATMFSVLGLDLQIAHFSIILPVGLSFYTFQAISRTVDCYRGRFDPGYSIVNYAAYHAFFPQLVAGPIERAAHLMPQFETIQPLNRKMIETGVLLFIWGLYQKIVIADNLAPIADALFNDPAGKTAGVTLAGIIAFSFQIYCDFSGYSNMARGLARCLGFDLMINFNLPYFARTPSEFWQRWHISLSTWLRDYLYIPLGGNRHGTVAMYRNLMITMLLGGLWHGAGWTFLAWGGFHGAIQVLYRFFKLDALIERVRITTPAGALINVGLWLTTMALVAIGWVFFRARSFAEVTAVLHNLGNLSDNDYMVFRPLMVYLLPLVIVETYQRMSKEIEILTIGPFLLRYSSLLFVIFSLMTLSAPGGHAFIYFDF